MGLEALLVLKEHGVEPGKVAVCHLDSGIDLDYCREIAGEGAFVEFDWFGWHDPRRIGRRRAIRRTPTASGSPTVAELVAEGLADQLLLSHDIATKTQLTAYGGCGFAHLSQTLAPEFERRGVDAATLEHIMRDNPARWLTWQAPREG